jgi:hypothetical protein
MAVRDEHNAAFGSTLRCVCMDISVLHPSALIDARDIAGRRCVSLMFASAIADLSNQPISGKHEAEVEAASDEWEEAGCIPLWQD